MRGPGILWMLQTAAGFSMAGPLFYLAGSYLLSDQYLGGVAFLSLGLLVLYFPTYLVNRFTGRVSRLGGPRTWVRRRLDRTETADEDAEHAPESATDEPSADGERSTANPLERLRGR